MSKAAVDGALAELHAAPISDGLRATLTFLAKVTRDEVSVEDVRAVLATGVTKAQLREALDVAWCFNVINRLADTFDFHVGGEAMFDVAANMLLKRGYKM